VVGEQYKDSLNWVAYKICKSILTTARPRVDAFDEKFYHVNV